MILKEIQNGNDIKHKEMGVEKRTSNKKQLAKIVGQIVPFDELKTRTQE